METRRERDRNLKWQRLLVVIGIFLFFAYETNAFAQPPEGQTIHPQSAYACPRVKHGCPISLTMPAFWKNPSMVAYLQLTKDQVAALNKAAETSERQAKDLLASRMQARRELEQALQNTPVDEHKVRALATTVGANESRLIVQETELRLQVAKVLTAQQKKAIEALKPPMCVPQ